MATKKKKLTVTEIKAIEPKADVYELNQYCKYMVMIKKSEIALHQNADLMERAKHIMHIMKAYSLPCAVIVGASDDIQIFELKGEKV